jgi:hypothetical protein
MKIYLIAFGLIFIGFILGFFVAAICASAGRATEMEERILRQINKEVKHG